jgi:antitoxin VapB
MGISIKREETEHLARQLAEVTGESLTDAIHNALAEQLRRLKTKPVVSAKRRTDLEAFLKEVRARPRLNDLTYAEIDADMYDEWGNPK